MGVDKKKDAEKKGKNADAEEEDEWGLDDDWGDLDDIKDKSKKGGAGAKPTTIMDDLDDLDDLPEIGSNYPGQNEDKFNQVMSSSKEGGGLLASIGLKKEDMKEDSMGDDSQMDGDDLHKKSNLFDTSKDRVGAQNKKATAHDSAWPCAKDDDDSDNFDLDFNSGKKDKEAAGSGLNNKSAADDLAGFEADLAAGMSDDDATGMDLEQKKAIEEQFGHIYEKDPELRKALEKSDVANFSVVEKY